MQIKFLALDLSDLDDDDIADTVKAMTVAELSGLRKQIERLDRIVDNDHVRRVNAGDFEVTER